MILFAVLAVAIFVVSAQQHQQIPCGFPPFADRMSAATADKLRTIWQNYQRGRDCASEQQQTFALVHSLSDSERTHIFGVAPPKPSSASHSQETTPMFIRTADAKFRQQFEKLWRSSALADEDKFRTLEVLAQQNLNTQQLVDFHQWLLSVKSQKQAIDNRIDALSDQARHILTAVTQLRAQEQKILAQMTPALAAELKGLL